MNVKKMLTMFVSVLLFLTLLCGIILVIPSVYNSKKVSAQIDSTNDFTQLTDDEQVTVNNDIKTQWGTPTALTELTDSTTITTSGNVWYYLTQDISVNFSSQISISGHVRILLNGYSISGSLLLNPTNSYGAKVSIFDKIPDMSGTGYDYNRYVERYYSFNSSTGGYTTYSTTQPSGTDVTDLPTWQANTYIKVTGSAIAPNSQNSSTSMYIYAYALSTINMYGVNVVGVVNTNSSILIAQGYAVMRLYQCNIIGNKTHSARPAVATYQDVTISMKGCKIYGNQTTHTNPGIEISNSNIPNKAADIGLFHRPNLTFEKSNIGALCGNFNQTNSYSKAVWLKDVDFKQAISGCNMDNFEAKIQNMNNITGTIELVYNNNLTYNGNSPNLNFIVHGGDSNAVPKKGFNNLTIGSSGVVDNITTVFDSPSKIIVQGTVNGLSTPGEVEIVAGGTVTVQAGQSVATLLNNGTLTLSGTVNGAFRNKRSTIQTRKSIDTSTKNDTAALGATVNDVSGDGTVTIESGAMATVVANKRIHTVKNSGTFNLSGTVDALINNKDAILNIDNSSASILNLTNNGDLTIASGTQYTIEEDVEITGTVTNAGILTLKGTVNTLINQTGGLVNVQGSSVQINHFENSGILNINQGATCKILTEVTGSGTIINLGNLGLFSFASGTVTNSGILDIAGSVGALVNDKDATVNIIGNNVSISNFQNSGTLDIASGISYNITSNQNIGGTIINNGNLTVDGTVSNLTHKSGSLNVSGKITDLKFEGGAITVTSSTASLPNDIIIPEKASFTVASQVQLSSTINLTNNGILNVKGSVESIENTGELIIEGEVKTLEMLSGTVTVGATEANIGSDIVINEHVIFNVAEGVIFNKDITNNGTLNIAGTANNINSTGIVNITNTGSVTLNQGYKIDKVINDGKFVISNNGKVDSIESSGQTYIGNNAEVKNVVVNAGYTAINDYSNVELAEVNGGTLEIFENANLTNLNYRRGHGRLIDHRVKSGFSLLLFILIAGGILLILILMIIILLMKKRRDYVYADAIYNRTEEFSSYAKYVRKK